MNDQVTQVPLEPKNKLMIGKTRIVAVGGILSALAASSCCIIPLVLVFFGVSGAWIGQLTSLSTYQPIFVVITLSFLSCGYWMVYRKTKANCTQDATCSHPLPNKLVKIGLWFSTALIALALAWPYIVPLILN
jgi:mercuric ion transport protein